MKSTVLSFSPGFVTGWLGIPVAKALELGGELFYYESAKEPSVKCAIPSKLWALIYEQKKQRRMEYLSANPGVCAYCLTFTEKHHSFCTEVRLEQEADENVYQQWCLEASKK